MHFTILEIHCLHFSNTQKRKRLLKLLDLQKEYTRRKNKTFINKIVTVLVEGPSRTDKNKWVGRTEHYRIAVFEKDEKVKVGDIVELEIATCSAYVIYGELLM